ncbi:MAG: site-specific integrase [Verrucomicrobiaceae bacterium]|nr:site-specific integrase [Verrucomicrobiaceae bacterium]
MASLWKHPQSKFWVACYTDHNGRQRKASTKIEALEKNRKRAMRVADEMETAHKRRMTTSQVVKLCGGLVKELTGEDFSTLSVREFLDGYLARRKREVSKATMAAYKGTAERFKKWLGDRADAELFRVEKRDVIAFRNHLGDSLHPTTANHALKLLRVFFKAAKVEGLLFENPCDDVAILRKESGGTTRRGFTLEELRIVLGEVKGTEWASLVRFGLYTGQRLGDLAALRWSQVDLENEEIRLITGKTRRVVIVPICKPLMAHIETLPAGDEATAFLHPKAAELGVSHLSREFGEVLARCGFRPATTHDKAEGKGGRAARRVLNELSFHSLRHSAVSMMKNAGISPAIVQDLIGHESAEVSAHYTHIEAEAKRKALETLPVI